jgi:hypothetical protein
MTAFKKHRHWINGVEDMALFRAIKVGEKSPLVSRNKILKKLKRSA